MSTLRRDVPGPPVRMVHLGLGSFFRAHQAWYTHQAGDQTGEQSGDQAGGAWGIAAFTGRRPDLADALRAQDGLYTLLTRAADGDELAVVRSVVRPHAADDSEAWLAHLASPDVRVLTTTITEAGYLRDASGGLDTANPQVVADVAALRVDRRAVVRSGPARLVAGLLARREVDAGPLALVPCDNLPHNGEALGRVLRDLADAVDPALRDWIDARVSTVTTMVDRITPEPTADDRATVLAATGVDDRAPVVTEPFTEWVLSGDFPGGRPAWEDAGAVLTADVVPFEERKLWLLNGAHSLLAYTGALRGHTTVAEAVADPVCRGWVEGWWDTAAPYLSLPTQDVRSYRDALLERFANPRMRHLLAQIAADGSQKLPVRFGPVLGRERAHGRLPEAVSVVLAAWVLTLRGEGGPVKDVRSEELRSLAAGQLGTAVPRVLAVLDPALADDSELVTALCSATGAVRR